MQLRTSTNIPTLPIGNTPLVRLRGIEKVYGIRANLYGKCEMQNASGSIKDRAVWYLLNDLQSNGQLASKKWIIEATSGNMGISMAKIAPYFGLQAMIFIPENLKNRATIAKEYGATVGYTPTNLGMQGANQAAEAHERAHPSAIWLRQFTNIKHAQSHERWLANELIEQLPKIDCLVAGVGTSATFTGVVRRLKATHKNLTAVAVEPHTSRNLSGRSGGEHQIFGIGAGFLPPLWQPDLCDLIVPIDGRTAKQFADLVYSTDALSVGISSGAAIAAACNVASRMQVGQNVVVILPERGDRG